MQLRRYCERTGHVHPLDIGDVCSTCGYKIVADDDDEVLDAVRAELQQPRTHRPITQQALCGRWTTTPKGNGPLSNGGSPCVLPADHYRECMSAAEYAARLRRSRR